jgi:glycosyltransferase involved in cell wall biosynthesis
MNREPAVSVILPVHNGETTLEETLASVLSQTLSDLELLVVDDASVDATPRLLAACSDPRLRWWRLPVNQGTSAARNAAFRQARGRFLALIDADDLWTPDKLEAQLALLEKQPEAVVAYSWTALIDATGRPTGEGARPTFEGDVLAPLLLGNFLESGSNPLVRRAAWGDVGGFDESLRAAEDWDFYLRLANRGPFAVARKAHVFYREHAGSVSHRVREMETCARWVWKRAFAEEGRPFRDLRRASLGNLYKYLFHQTYEGELTWQRGCSGVRCLAFALACDPALLRQPASLARAAIKAALHLLLPPALAIRVQAGAARLPGLARLPAAHRTLIYSCGCSAQRRRRRCEVGGDQS